MLSVCVLSVCVVFMCVLSVLMCLVCLVCLVSLMRMCLDVLSVLSVCACKRAVLLHHWLFSFQSRLCNRPHGYAAYYCTKGHATYWQERQKLAERQATRGDRDPV